MTSFTLTTLSTSPQALNFGEIGYIAAGAGLLTPGTRAVTMSDAILLNWGTVLSTSNSGSAVVVSLAGAQIENHGSMIGEGQAVISAFSLTSTTGLTLTN